MFLTLFWNYEDNLTLDSVIPKTGLRFGHKSAKKHTVILEWLITIFWNLFNSAGLHTSIHMHYHSASFQLFYSPLADTTVNFSLAPQFYILLKDLDWQFSQYNSMVNKHFILVWQNVVALILSVYKNLVILSDEIRAGWFIYQNCGIGRHPRSGDFFFCINVNKNAKEKLSSGFGGHKNQNWHH